MSGWRRGEAQPRAIFLPLGLHGPESHQLLALKKVSRAAAAQPSAQRTRGYITSWTERWVFHCLNADGEIVRIELILLSYYK